MAWYDVFSRFYNQSLEDLYAESRSAALDALELTPGRCVLDVPTGTGQSLDGLCARAGPLGRVLAIDNNPGMLERARRRAEERSLPRCIFREVSVLDLDASLVHEALEGRSLDRAHVFLGMSVFPEWERAFENIWSVLAPGGRMVIVDVYAERPGVQGHLVQLMAQAELKRQSWEPLEAVGVNFSRTTLPKRWQAGGELFCASADKPEPAA